MEGDDDGDDEDDDEGAPCPTAIEAGTDPSR
jgi:hypothetical protein